MKYTPVALPFKTRKISPTYSVAVSGTGDYAFFSSEELAKLRTAPTALSLERLAELKARFFVASSSDTTGQRRLMASRVAAKRETTTAGPALHILVPTLQCEHSCRYCQVSRSLSDSSHVMLEQDLDAACDTILESSAPSLTVEFQGGDPLTRFDMVRRAVERLERGTVTASRPIRYVVASTLHQLDEAMCSFFKEHGVFLSTSIDGPASLHNKNRPIPGRDAYERTVAGIALARARLGADAVSAIMTTTRESLAHPEAIVDEYVRLGLKDVFLRPLSSYGFAKRNQTWMAYPLRSFFDFYARGLERVLYWNRQGVELREVYASIVLNKLLSTFDGGYVDLQSPTGAGRSVLVYNYDGFVYPSDEARMLVETGDTSLRLGRIGASLESLLKGSLQEDLLEASLTRNSVACMQCAYSDFCAPNPVDALAQCGTLFAPAETTEHCQRHLWLFDHMFRRIHDADAWTMDLFHSWAHPATAERH